MLTGSFSVGRFRPQRPFGNIQRNLGRNFGFTSVWGCFSRLVGRGQARCESSCNVQDDPRPQQRMTRPEKSPVPWEETLLCGVRLRPQVFATI